VRTLLSRFPVTAFVGAAGTGKSQRAQLVARNRRIDIIIDDGLLIRKGQIACGKSAKSERNQVRAIRRALFQFSDHRREVRNFLVAMRPCRIMLVATSEEMAVRIARKLGLPFPDEIVHIQDVASGEEISRARKERMQKKQHVIPVSHVQVRRNFAGKLVGGFKVFWHKDRHQGEKTIVRPPFSFRGELHIEKEAIAQIATKISERTKQVVKVLDVHVGESDEKLDIKVHVRLVGGKRNFLEVARFLQQRLWSTIRYFSGIDVGNVDVNVDEVQP
jgi:uncharacterized alkaline shock family protein YloU